MIILDHIDQGTPEWFACRVGIPTASNFDKIVTSTGKKSTSWKSYAFKKAAELESGKIEETHTSDAMQRGIDLESEAREAYNFITGNDIKEVGLVYQDDKKLWSCSPDGLNIEKRKGLEIKCPLAGTHKQYCYEKKVPTKYKPQVFGSLWICDDIDSWDFMSYHPDLKPFITTIDRDNEEYKTYVKMLAEFLLEVSEFIKKVAKS